MKETKPRRQRMSFPTETQLGEAYYKRYGVYFAKGIIKKLTGQVTLSLRDIYSAFKGKEKNSDR